MERRKFIKTNSIILSGVLTFPGELFRRKKELRFGWVTDIHYARREPKWNRFYTESIEKLREAVELFNTLDLDFIIETGDFKDQNEQPEHNKTLQYLKEVESEFAKYRGDRFHVFGNHDVDSISKTDFLSIAGNSGISRDKTYYSFEKKGFRCIILDACFKTDGTPYDNGNFDWKNTIIPEAQLSWLKKELGKSSGPVLVFVHQQLDGPGDGDYFINNSEEVRKVLEDSGNVLAVFQGHYHEGNYNKINNIHYITEKALVDGSGEENNSYSVATVTVSGDIRIDGYRKMEDLEV
ncbi:MAG: hypothetical protein GXO47_13255 [Chlorobi bacterium]|nr:hypothetical protein [Chlorobiota bacterium]